MSDIEALRASMRAAQVSGKGAYIGEGRHFLEIERCFVKRTTKEGSIKETWICEFKVLESSNKTHEVGSTRSYVETGKDGWLGRWKTFLMAAAGLDPNAKITEQTETLIGDLTVALKHDDYRVQRGWPENFLKGRRVHCEGVPGRNKANTNDIMHKNWRPFVEAAAPTPAPAAPAA